MYWAVCACLPEANSRKGGCCHKDRLLNCNLNVLISLYSVDFVLHLYVIHSVVIFDLFALVDVIHLCTQNVYKQWILFKLDSCLALKFCLQNLKHLGFYFPYVTLSLHRTAVIVGRWGKEKRNDFVLTKITCGRAKWSCLASCCEPGEGQSWAGSCCLSHWAGIAVLQQGWLLPGALLVWVSSCSTIGGRVGIFR